MSILSAQAPQICLGHEFVSFKYSVDREVDFIKILHMCLLFTGGCNGQDRQEAFGWGWNLC